MSSTDDQLMPPQSSSRAAASDTETPVPDPSTPPPAPDPEPPAPEPEPQRPAAEGDPFESWPASSSATVIEEVPADVSVEHVRGEVDVPDGFTVLEGTPLGNRRSVGVVVSRFNGGVTNLMLRTALDALVEAGVSHDAITVMPVPGAFELPLAAMALAKTRRYACIVALGAIVRGETPHFDYVASECASGLQLAAIETGVPVSFGVLTVEDVAQAEARIQKAADAVRSALEMADLFARLRASARA
ncbi:MAG TPA: 6,7-dimethyl-8-ribityllumazine synthase [Gaiellaceae bacterium]|nr:6,7-dimethyl-8-ribityllumazine synthase [Gaiellaceae bacterium]